MIIGHEGLPGSGKSYEFLVEHVIPSVKKGRKVFAYVEGINHEKISQICDITIEKCKELIIQLTAEQVPDIYNHVEPNSIVGIDELQNFFPNHKSKLDEKMTKFIAEHRHYGLDIIVMGQNLKDCHSVWRRRIERKIIFYKLSALGKDKKYQWTAYQAVPQADRDPQYVKSASGFRDYEEKYFGSYASHRLKRRIQSIIKMDALTSGTAKASVTVFLWLLPWVLPVAGIYRRILRIQAKS